MARWRFDDPVTDDYYVFDFSPNDGGTPSYSKNITNTSTTAPDGVNVMMEGRDHPVEMEFKGVIRTEDHYNALLAWFTKRHVILLTDDLGRQNRIYITAFQATRKRAATVPWKHEYTMKCTVTT